MESKTARKIDERPERENRKRREFILGKVIYCKSD